MKNVQLSYIGAEPLLNVLWSSAIALIYCSTAPASPAGRLTPTPLTTNAIAQQAYLKASNTGQNDFFGLGLSISGDTVVVGAPLESSNARGVNGDQSDNSAPDSGAAYVFLRNRGVWSQQA